VNRPQLVRSQVLVPEAVEAGLRRCARDERLAWEMPRRSNSEWAARADRLAEVCNRQAHWWAVLGRWAYAQDHLPDVLARAAVVASTSATEHARSWSEMAGDWRRRSTEGCCEVAGGCGCGGDPAGVA
jgi:hypothetical protein